MISIIIVNSLNWFQLFIWNLGKDKDLIVLLQYIFTILTEADYLVHITFQALFWIFSIYKCAAKSLQSCLTLWDPRDGSPLVFPISGILEANTLESIAFPSPIHESEKWKWSRSVCLTPSDPMDCSLQAPPSMGFSRQEYWSGAPLPSPNNDLRAV